MAYTEEEMAQYQRLSNNYVPEAEVLQCLLVMHSIVILMQFSGSSYQSTTAMSQYFQRVCSGRCRLHTENNGNDILSRQKGRAADDLDPGSCFEICQLSNSKR